MVNCGCFNGNIDEFEARVKEKHGENRYAKEYEKAIELVKLIMCDLGDKDDEAGRFC